MKYGALSLEELQSFHARIFKTIDADKNGKVTLEEFIGRGQWLWHAPR